MVGVVSPSGATGKLTDNWCGEMLIIWGDLWNQSAHKIVLLAFAITLSCIHFIT